MGSKIKTGALRIRTYINNINKIIYWKRKIIIIIFNFNFGLYSQRF